MKVEKILVPTDFSKYANYASRIALQIAKETNARVEFFHQTHILGEWSTLNKEARAYYEKNFVKKEEAIEKLETLTKNKALEDVEIITNYGHGNLFVQIMDKVEDGEVDLIVMGTQGRSGQEIMLGSNTLKVLRLVQCPVITAKKPPKDFKMEKILFLSNFKKEGRAVLKKLLDFTEMWNSTIHLVNIDVNHRFKKSPKLFKKSIAKYVDLCGDRLGEIRSIDEKNIEKGLGLILKEMEVDLVAMGTHLREYQDYMYSSFITETIVQKAEVPVLTIPILDD